MLRVLSSQRLIPAPDEKERYIEVGPKPLILSYDGSTLGAIELHPKDAAGTNYEGELVLFLGAGTYDPARSAMEQSFNGEFLSFRRPPYVIENLPASPHSFTIHTNAAAPSWQFVEVEAGRTKSVTIALP